MELIINKEEFIDEKEFIHEKELANYNALLASDSGAKIPKIGVIMKDSLIPFDNHPFQLYVGERLQKLAYSIQEIGLLHFIVVRPHKTKKGKYEILCGHNRFAAIESLGWKTMTAIIRDDLTDDDEMALKIVIESNLNQQSFSDWKYSQQIRVIKRYDQYIKENSRQGKRPDDLDETTCAQTGHKLEAKPKHPKTRDKISKQLGISSPVFERYRKIAKLDDAILNELCSMLDSKRLGFMAAYHISQLKEGEIEIVMNLLKNDSSIKPKSKNMKLLYENSKDSKDTTLAEDKIKEILLT